MKIKFLIVGRSEAMRHGLGTLLAALSQGAEIDSLADLSLVKKYVQKKAYQMIFIYLGRPYTDYLEVFNQVRLATPAVKIIVIIEEHGQEQMALDAGAEQVMLRGFSASELTPIIRFPEYSAIEGRF